MAAKTGKQKCAKGKNDIGRGNAKGVFDVDPAFIRYTHSRISPKFQDGRSVHETWAQLRDGLLDVSALPTITVIKQSDECYFSENNRRLWVLKQCRDNGLLPGNTVPVRVRLLKENDSKKKHSDRWSAYRCSDTCTFLTETGLRQRYGRKYRNRSNLKLPDPIEGACYEDAKSDGSNPAEEAECDGISQGVLLGTAASEKGPMLGAGTGCSADATQALLPAASSSASPNALTLLASQTGHSAQTSAGEANASLQPLLVEMGSLLCKLQQRHELAITAQEVTAEDLLDRLSHFTELASSADLQCRA